MSLAAPSIGDVWVLRQRARLVVTSADVGVYLTADGRPSGSCTLPVDAAGLGYAFIGHVEPPEAGDLAFRLTIPHGSSALYRLCERAAALPASQVVAALPSPLRKSWRPGKAAASLAVEWRESAPTLAEVAAHEARGGWWWLVSGRRPPVADRLTRGDDGDGRGPFVRSSGGAYPHAALSWDEHGGAEWRGDAIVCPCDADGAPVAWPEAPP